MSSKIALVMLWSLILVIFPFELQPQPITLKYREVPQYPITEYRCLALALHHEARGEGVRGMHAVANVIMNRVKDPRFPDTICDVVFQRSSKVCQFSWVCERGLTKSMVRGTIRVSPRAAQVARQIMERGRLQDVTNGAIYFHSHPVTPIGWERKRHTKTIGRHKFFRS